MGDTNFDLAPPAKTVDGLPAVAIDIQRTTASLTFDGATQTGTGDATMEFTVGPQGGNPIFDLRQTIISAWLDGAPLPVAKLARHDFGGGPDAGLRIVESVLAAATAHTLRVVYQLGPPDASGAGSYQPAIAWSPGPRLAFNFGFTDLGAGRYLEAWVPANLIFDQFELVLTLSILNTPVGHTVITNGAVTILGENHWSINFPARFTALSHLLELRASDKVQGATDSIVLPASGANVTIEAWKRTDGTADLPVQIGNIKTYLVDDETFAGPYMHGNRFVAFLNVGGMEYDGGTTTAPGAVRHETFHSWWGRGVKPASQPDGWFDEAWTVYRDNGANEVLPLDFTSPPVTLCPRNPWIRTTSGNAYTDGYRFWKGIAALIGSATLTALMKEFYIQRGNRPVATNEIEEFLVCRTGNAQLVDAFHRFVYGFENPASPVDLWMKDDPAQTGDDAWGGRFWDSPDLWVRNADDGGMAHQSPEYGQSNWFHARVRNRGSSTARHFLVTFHAKQYAGVEFTYPSDFLPCIAASSGFELAPDASMIVKSRWPRHLVPLPGTHPCLTAAVLSRWDHPIVGRQVRMSNNLAQKNLSVVDLAPNTWFILKVVLSNLQFPAAKKFQMELVRPKGWSRMGAGLIHHSGVVFTRGFPVTPYDFTGRPEVLAPAGNLDCGGFVPAPKDKSKTAADEGGALMDRDGRGYEAVFPAGKISRIPVSVGPQEQVVLGLRLKVPQEARKGRTLLLDLVQRDFAKKRILGGIAVKVNVT